MNPIRSPCFRGYSMSSDAEPTFTPSQGRRGALGCRCSRAAWKLLARVAKAPCPVPSCPRGGVGVGWGGAGILQVTSVETETLLSDSQGPALFKREPSIISGFPFKARLFGSRVSTCPPRQILRVGAASVTERGVWVEKWVKI